MADKTQTGPRASGLVRITANLTAPCARDLDDLVAATGRNRTDLINRGIQLLAALQPHLATGSVALIHPDGSHDRLIIL